VVVTTSPWVRADRGIDLMLGELSIKPFLRSRLAIAREVHGAIGLRLKRACHMVD
jgi:hypothetical protein